MPELSEAFGQAQDKLGKSRLEHLVGRLLHPEPPRVPLPFLPPGAELFRDLERIA
jgi:hypothetical protein